MKSWAGPVRIHADADIVHLKQGDPARHWDGIILFDSSSSLSPESHLRLFTLLSTINQITQH